LTELGLRDDQEEHQGESADETSLAQGVQQLESKLRSMTSKAKELEGSLASSRSERDRLSRSLRDSEVGSSPRFLLHDAPLVSFGNNPPYLARQQLHGRLRDALTAASDLENRLAVSQQELDEARNQASQRRQTISLLVSEKNALAASVDRLAELESRTRDHSVRVTFVSPPSFLQGAEEL